ncbi:MAG: hypothetical protein JWP86_702 [Phenylobacterium sp.]|nr:hypothetical protein [Phenylobacterium sp.]
MSELGRGERLQIMLTEDELRALDDWRFTRRMPSRAAAVRELLRLGLAAEGVWPSDVRARSKDFGVVEKPDGHDDQVGSRDSRDSGGAEAG